MMRAIVNSIWFAWFALFALVVLVRGSEGLGQPVNLDVNDTIVFVQAYNNSFFPVDSVTAQFARSVMDVGVTFMLPQAMHALGLKPEAQFLVLYLVQMAALATGLLLFFRAFSRDTGFLLLALTIAYLSVFTGFGRYLALGAAFKIVSSTLALAIGIVCLGVFLSGRSLLAAILAALLATYHPSHGLIVLGIIGGHTAWLAATRRLAVSSFLVFCSAVGLALVPFLVLVVANLPPATSFDRDAWWSYVFSKTSNLTPLQDGVALVAIILAGLAAGIVGLAGLAALDTDGRNVRLRATAILVAVMVLWGLQIVASEVVHSVTLTQLALTRATPYGALVLVSLVALVAYRCLRSGDRRDIAVGGLFAIGAIGALFPQALPVVGLPVATGALIRVRWLFQWNVIEQASAVLMVAAAAWYLWLPQLTDAGRRRSAWVLVVLTGASILFFGLRLPSLSVALLLATVWKPRLASFVPLRAAFVVGLIVIMAAFAVTLRKPWRLDRNERNQDLIAMVEQHVPPSGMVLSIPPTDGSTELILPLRASYLGWGEGQYLIYMPALTETVWARATTLGISPVVDDPACRKWLLNMMCRRQLFFARARARNDEWRSHLDEMRALAPSLSHALIRASHSCPGDRPVARFEDLLLVPIEAVARSCPQAAD
ncbi:MAG: hypothetical protein ACK4GK_06250 [Ferrovibrio sp.]